MSSPRGRIPREARFGRCGEQHDLCSTADPRCEITTASERQVTTQKNRCRTMSHPRHTAAVISRCETVHAQRCVLATKYRLLAALPGRAGSSKCNDCRATSVSQPSRTLWQLSAPQRCTGCTSPRRPSRPNPRCRRQTGIHLPCGGQPPQAALCTLAR